MYGVGITPEGINQNYVMYEFALERGWDHTTVDASKWFDHYAFTRYGESAWDNLRVRFQSILATLKSLISEIFFSRQVYTHLMVQNQSEANILCVGVPVSS